MLETQKVDNKIRKLLFGNLRPLYVYRYSMRYLEPEVNVSFYS